MTNTTSQTQVTETRQLARFVSGLRYADLPHDVVTMAKWLTLNIVGCSAYGVTTDGPAVALRVYGRMGGSADATVIGTNMKLPVPAAAALNAQTCDTLNACDTHIEGVVRPGYAVISSALAAAERERMSGADFLTAVVAGYEVSCRVGSAISQRAESHKHVLGWLGSVAMPIASGVTAGKVLGLSEEQLITAIGVGTMSATGLFQVIMGSDAYGWDAARAVYPGVIGAYLAQEGMTMGPTPLEGWNQSFVGMFTGGHPTEQDFARLVRGLGTEWETLNMEIKSRVGGQTQTEAAQKVVLDNKIDYRQIKSIMVRVPKRIERTPRHQAVRAPRNAYDFGNIRGKTAYRTGSPYAIAVAIIDGRTITTPAEMAARMNDPNVLELERKVTIEASLTTGGYEQHPAYASMWFYFGRPTVAVVETMDGRTYEATVVWPKGKFPENPLTGDEMISKFNSNASLTFDEKRRERIVNAVQHLEEMQDIRELGALLQVN